MAKRLNYEVGFTAETSELNAALQKVQNDLSKISLGKTGSTSVTSEINEAADAAGRLGLALKNAISVDTGRLDLSKFAQ
ncbi:MAG: hypothetical protein NC218_07500 [Acetobacter sp.]|nr:hypothetical protein [Acetobacter sp.]